MVHILLKPGLENFEHYSTSLWDECRIPRFNSCVRKIHWRSEWQPTPVFLPGEFHGQRSLAGCNLWVHKESDTTEQLTLSLFCLKMWFKKLKLTVLFSENFPSFRCGRNWQKSDVSGKSIPFKKLAFLKNQMAKNAKNQMVKNPPAMQEIQLWFLGGNDPLEEKMATHSSVFAWRIPGTGEPGGLPSMGSQSRTRLKQLSSSSSSSLEGKLWQT